MGLHDPFEYLQHKLDQKKGQKLKCEFDSQKKVGNLHELHACKWCATYCLKFFNKDYNFVSNFISIKSLHNKVWASKFMGIPISKISGLST